MMNAGCVFLIALLHLVTAQGPPRHLPPQCSGPPPGLDKVHECCTIPPFFKDEDFVDCGYEKLNPSGQLKKPFDPSDCSKQICMFKKNNLLQDDDSVDYSELNALMDRYIENYEDFEDAATAAKEKCIGKTLPGPPHICEPNKIVFCIGSTLFDECPNWQSTEACTAFRKHIRECQPTFTN